MSPRSLSKDPPTRVIHLRRQSTDLLSERDLPALRTPGFEHISDSEFTSDLPDVR